LSDTSLGGGYCAKTNGIGRPREEKQVYGRQSQAYLYFMAYLWSRAPLRVSSTDFVALEDQLLSVANSFWINSVIGSAAPAFQL
jgi:hypothetical protein